MGDGVWCDLVFVVDAGLGWFSGWVVCLSEFVWWFACNLWFAVGLV